MDGRKKRCASTKKKSNPGAEVKNEKLKRPRKEGGRYFRTENDRGKYAMGGT